MTDEPNQMSLRVPAQMVPLVFGCGYADMNDGTQNVVVNLTSPLGFVWDFVLTAENAQSMGKAILEMGRQVSLTNQILVPPGARGGGLVSANGAPLRAVGATEAVERPESAHSGSGGESEDERVDL